VALGQLGLATGEDLGLAGVTGGGDEPTAPAQLGVGQVQL
jgi:hypothetical protein